MNWVALHDKTFGDRLQLEVNEYIKPPAVDIHTITMQDEYDKDETGLINNSDNRILYLGKHAGAGKSTASCCGYDKADALFVSPFNKQCIELKKNGYDAVTINKLCGKGIGDLSFGATYDWSKKKLIVFDEQLLNNMHF